MVMLAIMMAEDTSEKRAKVRSPHGKKVQNAILG